MKLYIISNRLPVKAAGSNGTFVFSRSEGGLATGLDSLQTSYEKHWIGWPGVCTDNEKDRQEMNEKLQEMNFHPVFLSEKQIQNYYEGYSNSTLWLIHWENTLPRSIKEKRPGLILWLLSKELSIKFVESILTKR